MVHKLACGVIAFPPNQITEGEWELGYFLVGSSRKSKSDDKEA